MVEPVGSEVHGELVVGERGVDVGGLRIVEPGHLDRGGERLGQIAGRRGGIAVGGAVRRGRIDPRRSPGALDRSACGQDPGHRYQKPFIIGNSILWLGVRWL
ncbi:MAG TPA: hypothetical protein VHT91_35590 [Kofleriaceae bacterium]|nr:hypothetical protein [Kofleriaceae bacterium]